MGNREALLQAAKRCLYEKGYERTTARDIAAASGVSLAAIGYHFSGKDALMNAAVLDALEEWGEEVRAVLSTRIDPSASPLQRFEATWDALIQSFTAHRPLWAVTFEVFALMDRAPELRAFLAGALDEGREGLASLFNQALGVEDDPGSARALGSFYQALMTGVLAQWLADSESAPSAHDLADALRVITTRVGEDTTSERPRSDSSPV